MSLNRFRHLHLLLLLQLGAGSLYGCQSNGRKRRKRIQIRRDRKSCCKQFMRLKEFVFVRLANLLSAKDELRSLKLWCSVGLRRSNFVHFSQVDMAKCVLQPSSAV